MAQRAMAEIALIMAPAVAVEDELLTIAWAAWRLLDLDTTMDPDEVESPLTTGTGAGIGASTAPSRSSPVVPSRSKMLVRAIFSLT